MAEEFRAFGETVDNVKMEKLNEEQRYDELSYQHHGASSYHTNLSPTFPGPREVAHLNDYIAYFYPDQDPLQTYQEKISRIQQFNEIEIPEFVAFINKHYPYVEDNKNHNGANADDHENDNVYSGQLQPSPSTVSRLVDLAVGHPVQGPAGSAMRPSHSHLRNRKKAYDAFELPQLLRPAPYVPLRRSDFVSRRVTEARARAAQYAYYKALRDQTEQDAMAMGNGMMLIAGAASLLEAAHEAERVPEQQQNASRRKRGKKQASGVAIRDRTPRTRKGRSVKIDENEG
jgi:hypothetical protein